MTQSGFFRQWFSPSFCACIVLLLTLIFQQSLVDFLTPFLFVPLYGAVWLAFGLVLVGSCIKASRVNQGRKLDRYRFFFLNLLVGLIALIAPFNYYSTLLDFNFNLPQRMLVVEMAKQGGLGRPYSYNKSLYALPDSMKYLSNGGGDVVVTDSSGYADHVSKDNVHVLFYTFRGILSHYSGFEYSADDMTPGGIDEPRQVTKLRKNWYWVAN
jgi:hypothetical protein